MEAVQSVHAVLQIQFISLMMMEAELSVDHDVFDGTTLDTDYADAGAAEWV